MRLTQVADCRVGQLSKVDKRKLSIAVELIGYPGLLLLDEAADRLTPFEEMQITTLLRELSRRVSRLSRLISFPDALSYRDKVIFLAPGGSLAWFGPVEEAFAYFAKFHACRERKKLAWTWKMPWRCW